MTIKTFCSTVQTDIDVLCLIVYVVFSCFMCSHSVVDIFNLGSLMYLKMCDLVDDVSVNMVLVTSVSFDVFRGVVKVCTHSCNRYEHIAAVLRKVNIVYRCKISACIQCLDEDNIH